MANRLAVHVLNSLQDLLNHPGYFDLGDVLVAGDHIQELTASRQLGDQCHAILVVIDLDQAGQPKYIKREIK